MPRPRLHQYWRDRIRSKVANAPNTPSRTLAAELAEEPPPPPEVCTDPPPSVRTVDRYREDIAFPEAYRDAYRWVRWPDTFERGDLPWEAVPVLAEHIREHLAYRSRLSVVLARWLWRVHDFAPGEQRERRWAVALALAAAELHASPEGEKVRRWAEGRLSGLTLEGISFEAPGSPGLSLLSEEGPL
ncbi:MAG: hypothetical protein WEC33_09790 [Dehalococcoidia bacterium]